MRHLAIALLLTIFVAAAGCVDSELLASAKAHRCELEKLAKDLEADPANAEEIGKQIQERTEFLQAVLDTASDRAALTEALAKETCP